MRRPSRERTLLSSVSRQARSHGMKPWYGEGYVAGVLRPRFFSAAHVAMKANVDVPARRTNVPDNLAVNGARDAVLQLEVHLGNRVLSEHRGIRDITCKSLQVSTCIRVHASRGVGLSRAASLAIGKTYGWQRTQPCCGW